MGNLADCPGPAPCRPRIQQVIQLAQEIIVKGPCPQRIKVMLVVIYICARIMVIPLCSFKTAQPWRNKDRYPILNRVTDGTSATDKLIAWPLSGLGMRQGVVFLRCANPILLLLSTGIIR